MKWLSKIQDSGIGLADQALVSGNNFIISIFLAWILESEAFGKYILIWTVPLFCLSIAQAFISKPMLTLGGKLKSPNLPAYLNAVFMVNAIVAGGILVVVSSLGFGWSLINPDFPIPVFLTALTCVGIVIHDFFRKALILKDAWMKLLFLDAAYYLVFWIIVCLSLHSGKLNLPEVFFAWSVSGGVIAVGGFSMVRLRFVLTGIRKVIYLHFKFSRWLIGTAFMQWFSGNGFLLASGLFLSVSIAGFLKITQQFVGLCHILFITMENIIPAKAAKVYMGGGVPKLKKLLKEYTFLFGVWVLIFLLSNVLLGPYLLELVISEKELASGPFFIGWSLIYMLSFAGIPARIFLRTYEITSPIFYAYFIGTIFCFASAPFLVSRFGISGFFAGQIMLQVIYLATYFYFIKKINYYENYSPGIRKS